MKQTSFEPLTDVIFDMLMSLILRLSLDKTDGIKMVGNCINSHDFNA